MRKRTLTATAIAAAVMCGSATAALSRVSVSPFRLGGHGPRASSAARPSRPGRADWEKIKAAARLRGMALAPHRTAHFRAFAGFLGLSELVSVHPLARGRCRTAVIDLYNNLLDLENAYPGENWDPLRRAVAREPSIQACAPRHATSTHA